MIYGFLSEVSRTLDVDVQKELISSYVNAKAKGHNENSDCDHTIDMDQTEIQFLDNKVNIKNVIQEGDKLILASIDSLGKTANEIFDNYRLLMNCITINDSAGRRKLIVDVQFVRDPIFNSDLLMNAYKDSMEKLIKFQPSKQAIVKVAYECLIRRMIEQYLEEDQVWCRIDKSVEAFGRVVKEKTRRANISRAKKSSDKPNNPTRKGMKYRPRQAIIDNVNEYLKDRQLEKKDRKWKNKHEFLADKRMSASTLHKYRKMIKEDTLEDPGSGSRC